MSEDKFDLSGEKSIIGRAVVLHAGTDDLGKGGDDGNTILFCFVICRRLNFSNYFRELR